MTSQNSVRGGPRSLSAKSETLSSRPRFRPGTESFALALGAYDLPRVRLIGDLAKGELAQRQRCMDKEGSVLAFDLFDQPMSDAVA